MAVHYVNIMLVNIDKDGNIIPPGKQAQIGTVADFSTEHRVAPNPNVPNSAGYPTVENYLIAEDGAGFSVRHMDQYTIVTQDL